MIPVPVTSFVVLRSDCGIFKMIVTMRIDRIISVVAIAFVIGYILYTNVVIPNGKISEVTLSNFKTRRWRKAARLVNHLGDFEWVMVRKERNDSGEKTTAHCVLKNMSHRSIAKYGVNMECSDQISLDRPIPDTRLQECKYWDYPKDMPRASVIIPFHNEGWSTLMRTVHSVINRTPSRFLEEILLVDDCSGREFLREKLERYLARFGDKVKLVRNKERQGLIRTKNRGAREAVGEVIVFLDSHCEVNINWLPPLLAPIYQDRTVMTVPIIDVIDLNNFHYHSEFSNGDFRGGFDWNLWYEKHRLTAQQEKNRKCRSEPYDSPTHAGGLLAVDRKFFLYLGAYDPGLLVWGGENMELSFKIWQCGGSIKWVPCSRVGHLYRKFLPYNFMQSSKGPLDLFNYKRVVETWFDPKHKEYFYTRAPLARYIDHGNISEQLSLKKRLQCKSFQWYMDNVAYDLIPDLPQNVRWGQLLNLGSNACMDTKRLGIHSLMLLMPCHGYGQDQLIRLNAKGQLAVGESCIDGDEENIKLVSCPLRVADGPWWYNESSFLLFHRFENKCLAVQPATHRLFLRFCRRNNRYYKWVFQTLSPWW